MMENCFSREHAAIDRADNALMMLEGYNEAVETTLADIMKAGGPCEPDAQSGIVLFFQWAGASLVAALRQAVDDMNPRIDATTPMRTAAPEAVERDSKRPQNAI